MDIEPRRRVGPSEKLYGYFGVGGYQEPIYDDPLLQPPFALRARRRRRLRAVARRRALLRKRLRNLLRGLNSTGDRLRPDTLYGALPTVPGEEGVLPLAEDQFEGSYVAISGRPGKRVLHIVNGRCKPNTVFFFTLVSNAVKNLSKINVHDN